MRQINGHGYNSKWIVDREYPCDFIALSKFVFRVLQEAAQETKALSRAGFCTDTMNTIHVVLHEGSMGLGGEEE